jgi:hypothetical protein
MCSCRPADTAVQRRPNTVSSTRTNLVTSHARTESIGTGIAALCTGPPGTSMPPDPEELAGGMGFADPSGWGPAAMPPPAGPVHVSAATGRSALAPGTT